MADSDVIKDLRDYVRDNNLTYKAVRDLDINTTLAGLAHAAQSANWVARQRAQILKLNYVQILRKRYA